MCETMYGRRSRRDGRYVGVGLSLVFGYIETFPKTCTICTFCTFCPRYLDMLSMSNIAVSACGLDGPW